MITLTFPDSLTLSPNGLLPSAYQKAQARSGKKTFYHLLLRGRAYSQSGLIYPPDTPLPSPEKNKKTKKQKKMCMTVLLWMWALQIILLLCFQYIPLPHPLKKEEGEAKENEHDCVSLQVWALQIILLLCFQDSDDISFEAYARIQHVLTGFWLHALAGIVQLVSSYMVSIFNFLPVLY